jgi:nucleoid DNA-binding protein
MQFFYFFYVFWEGFMATTKKTAESAKFDKLKKARTKSQIIVALAENTGLSKKEIGVFFDSLTALIGHDLSRGPGQFALPGLVKLKVVKKPAQPARRGTNPFTGEEQMFAAKPARKVVKIRPLKALKDKV